MKTTLLFLIALASLGLVACSPEQPVTAEQAREIERHQPSQPSPQAVELWRSVSDTLSGLSREDRHWLAQQLMQLMQRQGSR